MEKSTLGDRIKSQEKSFQTYIGAEETVIVRLDGDSFSKFTKDFRKPFDSLITNTMIRLTEELFKRFTATLGYTQSDEITLVIPASNEMVLGGKVQKLVSLTAGFASTRFNAILKEELQIQKDDLDESFYKMIKEKKIHQAWFDSRIFAWSDKTEVFNTVLWRMRDAERNSISMLADSVFSHQKLLGKNSSDKRKMLEEQNIFWETLDEGLKYGTIIKRQTFYKTPGVVRSRLIRLPIKLFYSEENVDLMFSKDYKGVV